MKENPSQDASIAVTTCMEDSTYWAFSGEINKERMSNNTKIYIRLKNDTISKCYEAFTTKTENSDYGYLLYQPKDELQTMGFVNNAPITADIMIANDDQVEIVATKEITLQITPAKK